MKSRRIPSIAATVLVFSSLAQAGPALTTLVNFNQANGSDPEAGLVADSAGNLYGTTLVGRQNQDAPSLSWRVQIIRA
jgi:hypothetical protein